MSAHALVIMGVERIACELQSLLEAFFIDDSAIRKQLFEGRGVLQTFGDQITIAEAIGLLTPWAARELRNFKANPPWHATGSSTLRIQGLRSAVPRS